jgi:hypothetical protein
VSQRSPIEHPPTLNLSITSVTTCNAYSRQPPDAARATRRLKPIITVYSTGTKEETKKFEGYITAAFWIGVDHAEGEVGSIKIRQSVESYDTEVATLTEFAGLMIQRQINFAVEFFTEPMAQTPAAPEAMESRFAPDSMAPEVIVGADVDFESELAKAKEEYKHGSVTKKQYETKKGAILKRWKEKVEGRLEG